MSPARGSSDGGPAGAESGGQRQAPAEPLEHSVRLVLTNRYGLHMRPAKQLMELANDFACDVDLLAKGQEVDAKSILGIIALGAECGDEVVVRARGPGAKDAAETVAKLLSSLPELHGEPKDLR